MIRVSSFGRFLVLTIACFGTDACLRRPATTPSRVIEPQLLEPQVSEAGKVTKSSDALPVRLLDTEARGGIGRRVLHQQPNGELTGDAIWLWASPPDRYLDTALRFEVASRPDVRLVDSSQATALATTILVWDLESSGGTRLVAAVEFQVTATDRVVHTEVFRDAEPVSAELPGDLAAAAGRLLRRVASAGLTYATNKR